MHRTIKLWSASNDILWCQRRASITRFRDTNRVLELLLQRVWECCRHYCFHSCCKGKDLFSQNSVPRGRDGGGQTARTGCASTGGANEPGISEARWPSRRPLQQHRGDTGAGMMTRTQTPTQHIAASSAELTRRVKPLIKPMPVLLLRKRVAMTHERSKGISWNLAEQVR